MKYSSITCIVFVVFQIYSQGLFAEEGRYVIEGLTFKAAGEAAVAASKELQAEYGIHGLKLKAHSLGVISYFPKLSLSAYEDEVLSQISTDTFMKNYSIGVEQMIFDGGRLHISRKIEKSKLALEYNALNRKAREISESAITMYQKILAGRMNLQIRENSLKALQEQQRILKTEFKLGMVLESELTTADISIKESQIEILNEKMELEEIEHQFIEMLGFDTLPDLSETIDVEREAALPSVHLVRSTAQVRNPDLITAQLSIKEKQEAAKASFLSWIPTLSANGNFTLRGTSYPLTHYTWSIGLSLQFASPWLSGSSSATTGFEDRTSQNFRLQGSAQPLSDPSSSVNYDQAKIALNLERSNYNLSFERLGRSAEQAVEKFKFIEQKRMLTLESRKLALEKIDLLRLKNKLGLNTVLDLMEAQVECMQKELELVQAALNVLAAEHEIEKLMDINTGELKDYVK
ncbi:MAG: hypothetical protein Ta2G_04320 [Termitinemataceae bacterium]|nr:MAG: hypothetical protein Ta2G_04320 [Termitinemataceae bacterium]